MELNREIRLDPLTGEAVVLSEARAGIAAPERPLVEPDPCPFCPGNEEHTEPTIEAIVDEDGVWLARAFANRNPMLVVEKPRDVHEQGVFSYMAGLGAHEVIVESRAHHPLHEQPPEAQTNGLRLATRRLADLSGDTRLEAVVWFRNEGRRAGASQRHPHAQVVGLPFVPARWQQMAQRAATHHRRYGRSLLGAVLEQEHEDGRRIVMRDGPITALCPYASQQPYEVWLVPDDPGPRFADASDDELDALSRLLGPLARAVGQASGMPVSYNLVALGAPERNHEPGLGWHLRFLPNLIRGAGFERNTGAAVHGTFPEAAATAIRGAWDATA
ncbi:MAG: hypothetical protein AAGA48_02455 [Myxococcota bacterium]